MKKITLLLLLLTSAVGFSQELLTNGDFQTGVATPWSGNAANPVDIGGGNYVNQAEVTGVANPWDVNLSQLLALEAGKTYRLSYEAYTDAATGTRTMVAGIGESADNFDALTDNPVLTSTPQTFTYDYTVNYNDVTNSRVLFDMGAQLGFVFIDNVSLTEVVADPTTDATLSDLQVNGVTISGFDAATITYTYTVPNGASIPTITATTTEAGANAVITQATAVPGDGTVVVTAQDNTTMKTYTVSFVVDTAPTTAAPTPPSRAAADVVSLYSDAYTDVASNFDAGWCNANSVEEVMIAGNATQKYLGNACQGIVLNNGIDVTSFTQLHVDIYIADGTDLTSSVFNLKFVQQPGGAALEINLNVASTPALTAGSWLSLDIPVDLTGFDGFKEFGITSNLNNIVWYDNLYVHKNTTLSTKNFNIANVSLYPNPATSILNINSQETIQSVSIYNILGREIKTIMVNSKEPSIDVENLSAGIYIIKYKVNNAVGSVKFIKE
ncbi:MAG: carbohydrate binding domain-containing protein [Flavobacteriaceae bacterium]